MAFFGRRYKKTKKGKMKKGKNTKNKALEKTTENNFSYFSSRDVPGMFRNFSYFSSRDVPGMFFRDTKN